QIAVGAAGEGEGFAADLERFQLGDQVRQRDTEGAGDQRGVAVIGEQPEKLPRTVLGSQFSFSFSFSFSLSLWLWFGLSRTLGFSGTLADHSRERVALSL